MTPILVQLGGRSFDLGPHAGEPLGAALRKHAGLPSVLTWCVDGSCGACRVLVDGRLVRSCQQVVGSALHGAAIDTLETLEDRPAVQHALRVFAEERPTRCRLCVGAVAVTAAWLVERPEGLEDAVNGLRCSCTGRGSLRRALRAG